MRQHAHPMRRPNRRRRLGTAVFLTALALAAAGLAWRPLGPSAGLTAGTNQALAQEATGSALASAAAPSASPAPTPAPQDQLSAADAAAARLAPAHVALDAWPAPIPEPPASLTGYVWPIAHPRLTLPFGPTSWGTRVVDGKLFHDGVDLATFCGDRIVAAHDGVVLAAGRQFDNFIGWVGSLDAYYRLLDAKQMWNDLPIVVIIDDGNTYRSVYAHFWKVVVHAGEQVHAGQLIGYEGMSGHATGCHLHYGLFSPYETATFGIDPKVARSLRLPTLEIARVDPLLVLPYRKGISGPETNLGSG